MMTGENSYSKLYYQSTSLSPLLLGKTSFQKTQPFIQDILISTNKFNEEGKNEDFPKIGTLIHGSHKQTIKTSFFNKDHSIFNPIAQSNKQLQPLVPVSSLFPRSIIFQGKTVSNSKEMENLLNCQETLLPLDESLHKNRKDSDCLLEESYRELSFSKLSRSNNNTVQNEFQDEAKEKIMEKKQENQTTSRSSKRKKSLPEKIILNSFFPQITKSLNNYLKNVGIIDGVFEPIIYHENRRRNPKSIVTIDRYNIKKVPQEFKDYMSKTFEEMNELEPLTEGEFYSQCKYLKTEVSSINDFFMLELNNFNNTDEVMKNDFDSDSEDEMKNEENYKKYLEKKEVIEKDTNENSFFGIDPIKEYGIICKWYKEELSKMKKLKTYQEKLEKFNLCKKIIDKIKQASLILSEIPFLRYKKTFPLKKTFPRKKMKKPKTFVCSFCLESFTTGCGLGKKYLTLGGHMSRIHPKKSTTYLNKKRIRKDREKLRSALKKAKNLILLDKGFHLHELLNEGNDGKMKIKQLLKESKKEFLNLYQKIKEREGL